jgi:hypothetical protein
MPAMTTKALLDREPVLRYLRKLTEERLGKRPPVGLGANEVTITGVSVRHHATATRRITKPRALKK